MSICVVGIDCATKTKKTGLALGEYSLESGLEVKEACVGSRRETPAEIVSDWLRRSQKPALLAMDAPLGWPIELSRSLPGHRAGQPIEIEPDELFMRATDRFIKDRVGKKPLSVGADRIARTSHAALVLLAQMQGKLSMPIPLAWLPAKPLTQIQVIEVYPAATLKAYRIPTNGYKSQKREVAENGRSTVAEALKSRMKSCAEAVLAMKKDADALDAVVCLLAASDFLAGRAVPPTDRELAETEGWIWCAGAQAVWAWRAVLENPFRVTRQFFSISCVVSETTLKEPPLGNRSPCMACCYRVRVD